MIALLLCVLWPGTTVEARTVYVRAGKGSDKNDGSSASKAFKTLGRLSQETFARGDSIIIGAGTYEGGILLPLTEKAAATTTKKGRNGKTQKGKKSKQTAAATTAAASTQDILLVGDVDGSATGDKGAVLIHAPSGKAAITLEDISALQIEDIGFITSIAKPGLGILINSKSVSAGELSFINCSFQGLSCGVMANCRSVDFDDCKFSNCRIDCFGDGETDLKLIDCQLRHETATDDSLYLVGESAMQLSNSTLTGGSRSIRLEQNAEADINNCSFTEAAYGIWCAGSPKLTLENSSFQRVTQAVSGTCGSGTITKCRATGSQTGVELTGTSDPVSITDSSFIDGTYGLKFPETGYGKLSGLTLTGNQVGLWIPPKLKELTLSADQKLNLAGCGVGVQIGGNGTTPASIPKVTLKNLSFSDHAQFAVLSGAGRLQLTGCSISRSQHGVYCSTLSSVQLERCTFTDQSAWAAVIAQCDSASLRNCTIDGCRNGVSLQLRQQGQPQLDTLAIDGADIAIAADQCSLSISDTDRLAFSRCNLGLSLTNCSTTLSNATFRGSRYPVYVQQGSLVARNVVIEGGLYGLYAASVTSADIAGLTVRDCTQWGASLHGQNLSVTDSLIEQSQNGLSLSATNSTKQAVLRNTTLASNTEHGLMLNQCGLTDEDQRKVVIRDNGSIGLLVAQTSLMLNASSGLEIARNGYGVYLQDGDLDVSGLNLDGNDTGLCVLRGKLTCRDTTISGGTTGIQNSHTSATTLERVTIQNPASYGVFISNSADTPVKVVMASCSLKQYGGGALVSSPGGGTVVVSDSTFADGKSLGLVTTGTSTAVLHSRFQNNSGYGIYAADGEQLLVEDCLIQETVQGYGVRAYQSGQPGGRLILRRNRLDANYIGIQAERLERLEAVNNVVSNGTYGIYSADTTAEVWHNTLVNNTIGLAHSGGTGTARNNLIASGDLDSAPRNSYGIQVISGTLEHSHNLLFGQTRKYVGTTAGSSDVLKPPRFTDYARKDYRLASGSPAINAGTDAGSQLSSAVTDLLQTVEALTTQPVKLSKQSGLLSSLKKTVTGNVDSVTDSLGSVLNRNSKTLVQGDIDGLPRPLFRAYDIGASEYPENAGSLRVLDWKEQPQASAK